MALTKVRGLGLGTLDDNITFSTAGKGVHLGVTSATASNLLDDYEEGTWTPGMSTGTVSTASGAYKKIGGVVSLKGYISGFSDSSSSNQLRVTGLPFTVAESTAAGPAMWENINNDFKFDISFFRNSDSNIGFYYSTSGPYVIMLHSHLDGSNAGCHFSGTYMTDQ